MEARKLSSSAIINAGLTHAAQNPNSQTLIPHIMESEVNFQESSSKSYFSEVSVGKWNETTVILKTFYRTTQCEPAEQFAAEMKIFERMAASNDEAGKQYVAKLFGYMSTPRYCFVLNYEMQGSLDKHIDDEDAPPFEWSRRVTIMQDTAKGIQFLHKLDIIHRDIKAANVLLDENFRAKVCDFNLSIPETEQKEATFAGSAEYLAIETLRGMKHTKSSDVFSFARLMCEISRWENLFSDAENEHEIYSRIRRNQLDPTPDDTPEKIANLINRGSRERMSERPLIDDVVNELNSVVLRP